MIDSPAPVRISVVTPTHNRPQSLLRLLHALRDGTFPAADFEAVIVADGCSDDTVARARAEPLPFRVSVLEQNPGRGAAAARNRWRRARNGRVARLPRRRYRAVACATGGALARISERRGAHRGDRSTTPCAYREPGPPRHRRLGLVGASVRADAPARTSLYLRGCVQRQPLSAAVAVCEVGGFDVEFNSCRDDSEFGLRAIRHGARIAFAPAATAWHHELRDPAALNRRKQAEGIADVRLARLYPDLWPSLRISYPELRALSALGIVRRLAFDMPGLGRCSRTRGTDYPACARMGAHARHMARAAGGPHVLLVLARGGARDGGTLRARQTARQLPH